MTALIAQAFLVLTSVGLAAAIAIEAINGGWFRR